MTSPIAVIRSVAWAFIESLTLIVFSLVTLLVIARLLGPVEFGIAATALTIVQVLNLFVEALFGEALVQRAELRQDHIDTAFWSALGVAAGLVALCCLCAGPLADLYGEPRLAPLLRAASFGLPFAAYAGIQSALLRRTLGFRLLAMRTLAARLSGTGVGLLLAILGHGPWSIIAQYLATTGLGALALWHWSPAPIGRGSRLAALKELLAFVVPWIANEALQVNLAKLFQLLAAYLLGPQEFAFVSIGFRVSDTLREVVSHVATNVALPVFARVQHDRAALARNFESATSSLCIIAMPVFAGLAICAPEVVAVGLGNAWLPAAPIVQILSAGAAIGFAGTFTYTVFSALGRPSLALPGSLFNLVAALSILPLLSGHGAIGAGLAWEGPDVVTTLLVLTICSIILPVRPARILAAIGRPALLAAIVAVVLGTVQHTALSAWPPASRLAILMLLGAVLLGVGAAILRPDLRRTAVERWRVYAAARHAPADPVPVAEE